jgi:hypothetical protein
MSPVPTIVVLRMQLMHEQQWSVDVHAHLAILVEDV